MSALARDAANRRALEAQETLHAVAQVAAVEQKAEDEDEVPLALAKRGQSVGLAKTKLSSTLAIAEQKRSDQLALIQAEADSLKKDLIEQHRDSPGGAGTLLADIDTYAAAAKRNWKPVWRSSSRISRIPWRRCRR